MGLNVATVLDSFTEVGDGDEDYFALELPFLTVWQCVCDVKPTTVYELTDCIKARVPKRQGFIDFLIRYYMTIESSE